MDYSLIMTINTIVFLLFLFLSIFIKLRENKEIPLSRQIIYTIKIVFFFTTIPIYSFLYINNNNKLKCYSNKMKKKVYFKTLKKTYLNFYDLIDYFIKDFVAFERKRNFELNRKKVKKINKISSYAKIGKVKINRYYSDEQCSFN